MEARLYQDSDYESIEEWGKDWGITYSKSQIPSTGFIVDGLAAYFLYTTPTTVCFMENMISNKNAPKEDVDKALNLIVTEILKEASRLGFKVAYSCTNNGAVAARAVLSGCKINPNYVLISKQLNHNLPLMDGYNCLSTDGKEN